MKIVCLAENTKGNSSCGAEHGLCYYVETEKHRLLMDTGASGLLIENAKKKGIDLTQVDTVILSHGHYDHGGGLPSVLALNSRAHVYMQESADGEYYSMAGGEHYIGLPREILESPQIVRVDGDLRIDDELSLFSRIPYAQPMPPANQLLKVKEGETFSQDDFRHEQCLVIREGKRTVLLSGCAHHGILNILAYFRTLYGGEPDYVFSGFHMLKRDGYTDGDIREIVRTAAELKKCGSIFYTGHCTGEKPFEVMRAITGDRLRYMHSGDEVVIREKKERKKAMKWHRFFAWASVFCFVMTMVTGYKHK